MLFYDITVRLNKLCLALVSHIIGLFYIQSNALKSLVMTAA